jgi:hypothetical protein
MRFNEVSELRHGREYRAACAAYDVFIIRWDIWIDNRLRGTVRTGKFFGHENFARALSPRGRISGRSSGQKTDEPVKTFPRPAADDECR